MKNKPKKIAIIGASYLQLPLVLRANEMGYETFCFSYMNEFGLATKKWTLG